MDTMKFRCLSTTLAVFAGVFATSGAQSFGAADAERQSYVTRGGRLSLVFDSRVLEALGLRYVARKTIEADAAGGQPTFAVEDSSSLELETLNGAFSGVLQGAVRTRGALLFGGPGSPHAIGDLTVGTASDGRWVVTSTLGGPDLEHLAFELPAVLIDMIAANGRLRLVGEIEIAEPFAAALGIPEATGTAVGTVVIEVKVTRRGAEIGTEEITPVAEIPEDRGETAAAIGPDVIVGDLYGPNSYGSVGGISAFAIGTISCNAGDAELDWIAGTNEHPVIAQNMFRYKDGRFEQIGQAWLKHGFFALQGNACGFGCTPSGAGGSALGVGCSDPYSASLNGSQYGLGPKSEVNASTGYFPYPPILNPPYEATIGRRLQVHNDDLDPALNAGAQYFIEGQYLSPDDAAAGNQNNNASYRPINVSGSGGSFTISTTGSTQREQPAIKAWATIDPGVEMATIQVDGLFYVFGKATDLGGGWYEYEYAIQNLNSHRSARSFSVPIDPTMTIQNVGFHDVDYHSDEVYDGTDWAVDYSSGAEIIWYTEEYAVNPDANALRWGTLYNFRFQADRPPTRTQISLGLFRPGDPTSAVTGSVGPELNPIDCNVCLPFDAPLQEPNPADKNRYLSFVPGGPGCRAAYRVTMTNLPVPFDIYNGTQMWVGEPRDYCENAGQGQPPEGGCGPAPGLSDRTFIAATLDCQPYYTDWSAYGIVHVYHNLIVPLGTYDIQAIDEDCDPGLDANFSTPLTINTTLWGDLVSDCTTDPCGPPDGGVDVVTDVAALIDKFSNLPGAPITARADLEPETPDWKITVLDIMYCVGAFQGEEYPYQPGPDPCP